MPRGAVQMTGIRHIAVYHHAMGLFRSRAKKNREKATAALPEQPTSVTLQETAALPEQPTSVTVPAAVSAHRDTTAEDGTSLPASCSHPADRWRQDTLRHAMRSARP